MVSVNDNKNSSMLFKNKSKNKHIVAHDAIINIKNSKKEPPVKGKPENNLTQKASFFIVLENTSDKVVHLNKHQNIGQLHEIEHIKEISDSDDGQNEFLNIIEASPDILLKRKQDLTHDEFKLEHLSTGEKNKLLNILLSNYQAFSTRLATLGHTDKIVPKINFTQEFPIKQLPFPIPQALQQEALNQLEELQAAGIVERAVVNWGSPMLLVKKKTQQGKKQKYRLALDLRMVNSIIQGSSYPLPKIQSIISSMAEYKFFTSLDLMAAYHQVDLPKEYREKFAFVSPFGSFVYKRLCFGMRNCASIFQALMDSLLGELDIPGVFAYQDDIILCSNSFEETCQKVEAILKKFAMHNITLCPSKCNFHKREINYLGFTVSNNMVSALESNIKKITGFPQPKTKRQLKNFIGVCSFYRNLVPSFADLIKPLVSLTTPSSKFIWTEQAKVAFEKLQHVFVSKPFVIQPNFKKPFTLNTDASKFGVSAVLLQEKDGKLLPVSYFSKMLSKSEMKYPAIKLELMAIYKGIMAFKYYLFNRHFFILSDAKPLAHYRKISSPADLITRWLMELSEYNFTFKHIKGSQNVLADFLSRIEVPCHTQDLDANPDLIKTDEILPIVENNHVTYNQSNSKKECKQGSVENSTTFIQSKHSSQITRHSSSNFKNNQHVLSNSTYDKICEQVYKNPCKRRILKAHKCPIVHLNANINSVDKSVSRNCFCNRFMNSTNTNNIDIARNNLIMQNNTFYLRCNALTVSNNRKRDPLLEISNETFVSEQEKDEKLSTIIQAIRQDPSNNKFNNYFISPDDKVLMFRKFSDQVSKEEQQNRIVVPKSMVHKVLAIAHLAHFGVHKTYQAVAARYYWQGMYTDTLNYVSSCTKCIVAKPHTLPKAPWGSTYIPSAPAQMVSIDLVGKFSNGAYILTIVDNFSKYLELYILFNIDANHVVDALFDYIVRHGRPAVIVSDLGTQFTSQIFNAFTEVVGIKLNHTTSCRPQGNSIAERVNFSIKSTINTLIQSGHNFRYAVQIHKNLYNESTHSSSGTSPNLVHFGRPLSLIYDTHNPNIQPTHLDRAYTLAQILQELQAVYRQVFANLKSKQTSSKQKQHDRETVKLRKFKVHDIVYLKGTEKFKPKFTGPYEIVTIHDNEVNYSIKFAENPAAPTFKVHVDRLFLAPPRLSHIICNDNIQSSNPISKSFTGHKYNLRKK